MLCRGVQCSMSCVYCLSGLGTGATISLCRTCTVTSCTDCMCEAMSHALADLTDITSPMRCPACRTDIVPSVAQVLKNDEMWICVSTSCSSGFWNAVGLPGGLPESVSAHLFDIYICIAVAHHSYRSRLRKTAWRYASLRWTPARASHLVAATNALLGSRTQFLSASEWIKHPPTPRASASTSTAE